MGLPRNGLFVVQGEMSNLVASMKRGNRWSSHSHQMEETDSLIHLFTKLKEVLTELGDLQLLDPNHYFEPFLEVIRSEETTGPVTSLALSSVSKFLSYNLIDPCNKNVPACVDNIADAVTHARFVGTDQASDGVVLMNILKVLRTLMLSPVGYLLSDESAYEIMLSTFRICFETRLSELLRHSAEYFLLDLVQLLFTRLPEFSEDHQIRIGLKKLKMRAGVVEQTQTRNSKRKGRASFQSKQVRLPSAQVEHVNIPSSSPQPADSSHTSSEVVPTVWNGGVEKSNNSGENEELTSIKKTSEVESSYESGSSTCRRESFVEEQVTISQFGASDGTTVPSPVEVEPDSQEVDKEVDIEKPEPFEQTVSEEVPDSLESTELPVLCTSENVPKSVLSNEEIEKNPVETPAITNTSKDISKIQSPTYVNQQGVRFTSGDDEELDAPLVPYGVECIRELFGFLISLCNPADKQNTEKMLHIGLSLITVALEVGADSIGQYQSLLALVKDDLCRNLFALLNSERIPILTATLRVSFLLFESLRTHLKFQLECYVLQLADIVAIDSPKVSYEHKEIALDAIVQLWRIPGFVTELYLNYDCDLYCSNVFEDLAKLLSKNTFPVSGLYRVHLLSLDALLTVVDSIERNCHCRMQSEHQESVSSSSLRQDTTAQETRGQYINTSSDGGRIITSQNIPTHEQLMAVKHKKKILATGTEQFNAKPKKGIQYLQEHHLLTTPLDTNEVVHFLRENPRLDKKMIGEYISNRENLAVLDSFVKSFDFADTRIDEALRQYLEVFRLPGESPLISLVLEHFADHWHKSNGEPFANNDAAFTLAYAVIMLNVDQHNHHAKRQNNPMTTDEFKRNLKKVNGGRDFDENMLDQIYTSIRSCEIVMPAEQTGVVRENYLWKVLLRRGTGRDGVFIHAPGGLFDHDLFSLIWGPSVAALSFIFDRSNDISVYQKAITGFLKCALISAHYGMSNDFDNLIISLCKFTTLITSTETFDTLPISFGSNPKAQLVTRTVFGLAQRHGDILRLGWANVLDCLLQLYRCKLLPKALTEAEDFLEPNGKISLMREEAPSQKAETGLLSSLYSYIALSSEPTSQRLISQEDQVHTQQARHCVRDCHLEHLITESKFLRIDSLQEMVKALILASHGPDGHPSLGSPQNEDAAIFFLELLIKVIIQNRDRVGSVWCNVRDYIYSLLMGAAACEHYFLMERCVVGLLRLAIRLMRREEMSPMILQSLRMLLLLKWSPLSRVSRNVAFGLHELLKTSAANIHTDADWSVIFTLLEVVGAGAPPPRLFGESNSVPRATQDQGAKSDGELQQGSQEDSGIGTERGYTSDSELSRSTGSLPSVGQAVSQPITPAVSPELSPTNTTSGGWIMVGREGEIQPLPLRSLRTLSGSSVTSTWDRELLAHDPQALIKCCESLTFLVRDVAHITPYNFEYCVHCIRTFVEASLHSTDKRACKKGGLHSKESIVKARKKLPSIRKREDNISLHRRARSPHNNPYDADESDSEELPSEYPIQLLDLMHTLHTRTAQIYRWWAEESGDVEQPSLWSIGWCPLLQGIARLCCDSRKEVRMSAITYLQSALLMHDLQTLSAQEWESCFSQVLFPLLARLLEPVCPGDPACRVREEETRMRAATLLSKVFLHHLTPLLSLPNFTALWLTIIDFLDKYMHAEHSDLLLEAIPETLKNMLLVMDSARIFSSSDGYSPLWAVTWERIDKFLPSLRLEFMKAHPAEPVNKTVEIPQSPDYEVVPNQQEASPVQREYQEPKHVQQEHHSQLTQQHQPELQQQYLSELPPQHQPEQQQQLMQTLQNQPEQPLHIPQLQQHQQPQHVADSQHELQTVEFAPIHAPSSSVPINSVDILQHPVPISPSAVSTASGPSTVTTSASGSNIILQPLQSVSSAALRAHSTTIFPHLGQLVSTPITGPPALHSYSNMTIPPPSALPAIACQSSVITPEAVLEAFTPTRGLSSPPCSYASSFPLSSGGNDGGVIPASRYFYQEQPQPSYQHLGVLHSANQSTSSGIPGVVGNRGILLEGANIPTLPILSPFPSSEACPSDE